MKRLIALLLAFVMLSMAATFSSSALFEEVTDDFLNAARVYYNNDNIKKNWILIIYLKELSENKYVTHFDCGFPDTMDMLDIFVGGYYISTPRPAPVIYADGVMYDLNVAYDQGIIDDADLYKMSTFEEIDMISTKATGALIYFLRKGYNSEDYVNIRFKVQGSEKTLSDIDENYAEDVSGSIEKLNAYYESLHQKLLNETLAGFDYIDRYHNNGVSIVAIKHKDIESILSKDFVTQMHYMSDVHMRYIETYKPRFKEYTYSELLGEVDENKNRSHGIIFAHSNTGATAEVGFRFGDLIVKSPSIYTDFTYGIGVYDYNQDKFFDLYDLKDTPDKYYRLQQKLASRENVDLVGDYDSDNTLSVLDATGIQRSKAQLDVPAYEQYVSHNGESVYVADMDNDGYVSVMDATEIQIKLASKKYYY